MDDADFGRARDAVAYAMGWTMGAAADFVRREMTSAQRQGFREIFEATDAGIRYAVNSIRETAAAQASEDVAPRPPEA